MSLIGVGRFPTVSADNERSGVVLRLLDDEVDHDTDIGMPDADPESPEEVVETLYDRRENERIAQAEESLRRTKARLLKKQQEKDDASDDADIDEGQELPKKPSRAPARSVRKQSLRKERALQMETESLFEKLRPEMKKLDITLQYVPSGFKLHWVRRPVSLFL